MSSIGGYDDFSLLMILPSFATRGSFLGYWLRMRSAELVSEKLFIHALFFL